MNLFIRIRCTKHGEIVQPAGDQLHMIQRVPATGWHEVDLGDTWCPVSDMAGHVYSFETATLEEDSDSPQQ